MDRLWNGLAGDEARIDIGTARIHHPIGRNAIARGDFSDVDDLATGLKEGADGGYDHLTYGGMGEVQQNIAELPDTDIHAIAEYIASLK